MFRIGDENSSNNTANLCNSTTIDGHSNLIVHVPTKRARLSSSSSISSITSSDDNTTMSYNSSYIDDEDDDEDDDDDTNDIGGRRTMPPYLSLMDIAMLDWQEAQLCRCIVDNAVNVVVESYRTLIESDRSDTPDTPEHQLAQAVEVDSDLEESAILMAINEHGLQQHNISNDDDEDDDDLVDTDSYDDEDDDKEHQCSAADQQVASEILKSSPPTPPLPESRNSAELTNNDVLPSISGTTTKSINQKDADNKMAIIDYGCSSAGNDDNNENDEDVVNNTDTNSEEVSDHFSFIETAVAVAIEKKGLTKSLYAIQMSPNR